MSTGTEAYQLVCVFQVGPALIVFALKPRWIYQQVFWSWLARKRRNWHVRSSLSPLIN